jgi:uncharacterized protein
VRLIHPPAPPAQIMAVIAAVQSDGTYISVATLASAVATAVLLAGIAALRSGAQTGAYLGLAWPDRRAAWRWALIMAALLAATDAMTALFDRPVVPDFMANSYTSARWPGLFFIALVGAAPIGEELLFRGFVLKGLAASRLGAAGAVAITALGWAVLHGQYDSFEIATIFLMGVALGVCRLRTGSTLLTMSLHAGANGVALAETLVSVHGAPLLGRF